VRLQRIGLELRLRWIWGIVAALFVWSLLFFWAAFPCSTALYHRVPDSVALLFPWGFRGAWLLGAGIVGLVWTAISALGALIMRQRTRLSFWEGFVALWICAVVPLLSWILAALWSHGHLPFIIIDYY
jgi:hypothetical protein